MLLSTKPTGSLTKPRARSPAAAPMFAARDPQESMALRLHINRAPRDLGNFNRTRTSSEVANKVAERFGVAEY
jgi:hypothetical protein